MKIIAKTRFGSVYDERLNHRFFHMNKKQLQSIINRLNKPCELWGDNYVYITATGSIYWRKSKDKWVYLVDDVGGYKWLKSDKTDKDYDPYYYLGVHYFYLAESLEDIYGES